MGKGFNPIGISYIHFYRNINLTIINLLLK